MKTDNTMPRYTVQEIADDFFTDGVLWDVWGHSSCIEGDKLKVTTPDGVSYYDINK